jgi:hypothetical protein
MTLGEWSVGAGDVGMAVNIALLLVTARTSRIGGKHGLRARLGPALWDAFVRHANQENRTGFECSWIKQYT